MRGCGKSKAQLIAELEASQKRVARLEKVEEALRESEERYRILFADSPDSYLIIVDGVFVDCNRASEILLRGSRSQIVGQKPDSISPEFQPNGRKSSDIAEELIKDTLLTGKNTFDWVHRRLDGTNVDVNVSIASMVYKGRPALFTAWRDITGRKRVEKAVDESNRKLENLSITDGLTNLYNRRHLDDSLEVEFSRHLRTGVELSLIMLDIDYFKAFNDNYGHVNGDECLRKVASVMFNCASRPADLNARYGGEEFVCILPSTDLNGAITVAEKIRRGIMNLAITHMGSDAAECVTASFGVVTARYGADQTAGQLVTRADQLLYQAKSRGRNRLEFIPICKEVGQFGAHDFRDIVQLSWKENFCCGNSLVDSQHKLLFSTANELLEAILSKRPTQEISSIIIRLLGDVSRHFYDEERVLSSVNFPGIPQHAAEHTKLLEKAVAILQGVDLDKLDYGEVFMFLVQEMIMVHILGFDRDYVPYIKRESQ